MNQMATTNDGLITHPSPYPVPETLDRLEAILKAKGIKIFARIDHAAEAEKAGLQMPPTEVLIFGNPKGGTPAMLANPKSAIDLPIKALAFQDHNGQVLITYNDPQYLQNRFNLTDDQIKPLASASALIELLVDPSENPLLN
jgi:uncharacterized protein (DUF302 family)